MRANRAFRLNVTRADRHVRIEVVSIADEEPMLYWDLPAHDGARLARELRADLAGMTAEEFVALWEGADQR